MHIEAKNQALNGGSSESVSVEDTVKFLPGLEFVSCVNKNG